MESHKFFQEVRKNYPLARELFKRIDFYDETDGFYRIYHNSFKMYSRLQSAIIDYLNVLFCLTGAGKINLETDNKSTLEKSKKPRGYEYTIEDKLKVLDVSWVFKSSILDALKVKFETNDRRKWYSHQKALVSGMHHAISGIRAIMHVSQEYYNHGRLPGKEGTLSTEDAICEHILNFSDLRYVKTEELRKKIKGQELLLLLKD